MTSGIQTGCTVLLSTNDEVTASNWMTGLRGSGYETSLSLSQLQNGEFAVALIDLSFDSAQAYALIAEIRSISPDTQIITFAKNRNAFEAIEAERRGAFWHFTTAVPLEELLFVVARACIVFELASNNRLLSSSVSSCKVSEQLSAIAMDAEFDGKVERLASVGSTIMITGETGTGKTTLAHLIHERGKRKNGPFITVSCASIPRDLLEAELFGYERGAFTGAVAARAGCVELANGGTLFLDEIGELSLDLQPKLLSVLQDREVRRLGSTKSIQVDVRVIAATNSDLEMMVSKKAFREDLFYRLDVARLAMKPLRERIPEIQKIAETFMEGLSQRLGERKKSLSPSALAALTQYSWPGNIRELQNILERAVVFTAGYYIGVKDLQFPATVTKQIHKENSLADLPLAGLPLADVEREVLHQTLRLTKGDKKRTAELLGVSNKTVYNKVRTHKLD